MGDLGYFMVIMVATNLDLSSLDLVFVLDKAHFFASNAKKRQTTLKVFESVLIFLP